MDVSWKDLLLLIQSSSNILETCDAIVEVLELDVTALPDIFHAITFELLVSHQHSIRENVSVLLGKLGLVFSYVLAPLICHSGTDGDLLNLSDINIHTILSTPGATLQSKLPTHTVSSALTAQSIYTQEWLVCQRKELKLRMGLDLLPDVWNGTDSGNLISEDDVRPESAITEAEVKVPIPYTLNVTKITMTEESWLARIVRCMIVGLLSPRWEVRHGYSLGLSQLLCGIFPDLLPASDVNGNLAPVASSSLLPDFICNDILCCGVCVLLLDRFVDFGCSDSRSVSPVKEVVGKLVASVLTSSHKNEKMRIMWNLTLEMAKSEEHWTVALGGFVSMKNLIPCCAEFALGEMWQEMVEVISGGVRTGGEAEVMVAACSAICACSAVLSTRQKLSISPMQIEDGFIEWIKILSAAISTADLVFEEPPSLVCAWGDALKSIAFASEVICEHSSGCDVDRNCALIDGMSRACAQLMGRLFAYDGVTRRHCLYCVAACARALTVASKRMLFSVPLHFNDSLESLRESIVSLIGAVAAAGCLSSQHTIQELRIDDTNNRADIQLSKYRASKSKEKTSSSTADDECASIDVNECSSPAIPCNLGIVQHYEERELWAYLASGWVGLAFTLHQERDVRRNTGCGMFLDVTKSSIRSIIVAAVEWSLGVTVPTRWEDGSSCGAQCVFKKALQTFCSVEAARRPLETNYSTDSAALASIIHLDYLSVIVSSFGRCLGDLCSCSFDQYRAEINSCLSHAVTSMQIFVRKRKAESPIVNVPAKKRTFKFIIVPDTVQQPKLSPAAVYAVGRGTVENDQLGVAHRTMRMLSLIWAELAANDAAGESQLENTLSKLLDSVTNEKDRSTTLLRFVLRNEPHHTIVSHQNLDNNNSLQDAQLQLFLSYSTARHLSQQVESGKYDEFTTLWKLFLCGGLAEEFASQIIYCLAKERQIRIADILADGLLLAANQHLAASSAERILLSALSACSYATRAALNTRFHLVERELSVVGTVRDSTGVFVNDVAEVLCILLEPAAKESPTSDQAALPQLAHVVARLHELLFPEHGCESSAMHRDQLASTLERLTARLPNQLIYAYEILFATALHGLGDRDVLVRQSCVRMFRLLVPLASLAKQTATRRSALTKSVPNNAVLNAVERSCELLEHIFNKQSPFQIQKSQHLRDVTVMEGLSKHTNLVKVTTPALSQAQLRDYQWDGVSWLTQLRRFGLNGILADEMGLGKSLQALTAVAVFRMEKSMRTGPTLIVCPASVVMHWEDEVKRYFSVELLRPVRFASGLSTETVASDGGASVVIVSYEMLRRDVASGHRSLFKAVLWETIVLDEAHLIKNPSAGTTRAVCSLQSLHRMALSGTPVQNQVEELWSLMNFLLPDYIGDIKQFRKDIVNPIVRSFAARRELRVMQHPTPDPAERTASKKNNSSAKFDQTVEISAMGLNLLRKLHKQVLPFILRRTKEVVAQDLPSKTVVDVLCPLSAEQRQLYLAYQNRLHTSDELLQKEFESAKDTASGYFADSSSIHMSSSELAAHISLLPEESVVSDGWGGPCGLKDMNLPAFEEDGDEQRKGTKTTSRSKHHALEALNYLRLLCLHPALVVEASHGRFRTRLLESSGSSGKLVRLAVLLMDSGVIAREDFHPGRRIEDLLQLDGDLMEQSDNSKSSSPIEESDDEVESEEHNEEELHVSQSEVTQTAKGEPLLAAAHIGETLEAELAAPLHRCLIFAQHRAALDLVEEQVLQKYFPAVGYERMDGSMDSFKRSIVARKFNDQQHRGPVASRADQVAQLMTALPAAARATMPPVHTAGTEPKTCAKDIRILLMTTRSCGLGLNLTAADTVIFLEHDWNPFADLQAMDRVHRIGQTQPVTIYRLLAENTIEARIMKLQSMKQSVASQVINEENAGAAGTAEERAQFGRMLLGSLLLRPNSVEQHS